MLVASPASAQFSQGFKFLEAVKKKDGAEVESAISEPGSTIINTRDITSGETALHIVTNRRDPTWLAYLLAKGANPNIRDKNGIAPLQIATNLGWEDGVSYLIAANARLDNSNDAGETALISAVHRGDVSIVRMLLKAGADPDRADNSGRSARDYAMLSGRSGPLMGAIEANAKEKGKGKGSGPVYGPTF